MIVRVNTDNAVIPYADGSADHFPVKGKIGEAMIPYKQSQDPRSIDFPKGFGLLNRHSCLDSISKTIPDLDECYAVIFDPDQCPPEAKVDQVTSHVVMVPRKDCSSYYEEF